MFQYPLERTSRPRIISVTWLSDPGVGVLKFPDKGEDPYAICNHGMGVPLGHALISMQEVAWPVPCVLNHQCGPVVVAVKRKLCTTGTLMPDSP